jgi:hypothetical protein
MISLLGVHDETVMDEEDGIGPTVPGDVRDQDLPWFA